MNNYDFFPPFFSLYKPAWMTIENKKVLKH